MGKVNIGLRYSIFLMSLVFPIFIFPGVWVYRGSSLGGKDVFVLPLSVYVVIFLFITNKRFLAYMLKRDNILLVSLLIMSMLSYLVVSVNEFHFSPQLFIVSLMPFVMSYFLGYDFCMEKGVGGLNKAIDVICYCSGVVCILHIGTSALSHGFFGMFLVRGDDSILGLFSIYQKLIYYPTLMSFCFLFCVFKKKCILGSLIFLDVILIGSRESMLICFLALFGCFSYYLYDAKGNLINRFLLVYLIVFLAFISALVILAYANDSLYQTVFIRKFITIYESGDFSAGRIGAINKVFESNREAFNVFVGTGFSMLSGDIRSPHNQYLEIMLRGGAGVMVILIMIGLRSWSVARKYLIIVQSDDDKSTIVACMFLIVLVYLISFNINTPIRAPYSSVYIGFFVGFFSNTLAQRNRHHTQRLCSQ